MIESISSVRKPARWVKTTSDKIRWVNICNKHMEEHKKKLIKYEEMYSHWQKERLNILDVKDENEVLKLLKEYKIIK